MVNQPGVTLMTALESILFVYNYHIIYPDCIEQGGFMGPGATLASIDLNFITSA